MNVAFDTNVLVYASAADPDAKTRRARELITRGMRSGSAVLLLQTLAEFSHVAMRKAGIAPDRVQMIVDGWRAVLPVRAATEKDLADALEAVKSHCLAFWDAMLWATARRVGIDHLITEDLQDGFILKGVKFSNPFNSANDELIDRILPP
jgi:predicted nucleic acid-binding protein